MYVLCIPIIYYNCLLHTFLVVSFEKESKNSWSDDDDK